jgi:hypothetical protein
LKSHSMAQGNHDVWRSNVIAMPSNRVRSLSRINTLGEKY